MIDTREDRTVAGRWPGGRPVPVAGPRRWRRGAVVALLGAALAACGGSEAKEPEPGAAAVGAAEVGRVINVETLTVRPTPFVERIRIVGTVEAERDVTVAAEEGGVIRELYAEKGARLRADQPIVKIDDRVLRAQLEQARAEADLAGETWDRQRRLWEEDRIGTEIAYLNAKYRAQTARARARELAERLARSVVRAPYAGILDDRFVEIGTRVAPGTPVARILDVDTAVIRGGVPERYASDIEAGAVAAVVVDALGGRTFDGTIEWVGAAVDPDNRTFTVEIVVPNPGASIKPGMVADVRLDRRALTDAIVVPQQAVLRREQGYIVYAVEENEAGLPVARARQVEPGSSQEGRVVIESGLRAGDRVVVVGQQQLAAGDRVRVVNEEADQ